MSQQLTKSRDFRQNYLCDFYLWKGNFRFKARNVRGDTSEKEENNGTQPKWVVVETKGKERGPGERDRRKEVYSLETRGVVQARDQSILEQSFIQHTSMYGTKTRYQSIRPPLTHAQGDLLQ